MPPPKSHGREPRSDLRQDGNVREVVERALQAGQPLEDIDVVVRARYACAWGSGDALLTKSSICANFSVSSSPRQISPTNRRSLR